MATPTFDAMTSGLGRMAQDLNKSHESAQGLATSFTQLLQTLLPIGVAYKAIDHLIERVAGGYKEAFKTLGHTTDELVTQRAMEVGHLERLERESRHNAGLRRMYQQQLDIHGITYELHKKKLNLTSEINKAGETAFKMGELLLAQSALTLINMRSINEAAQEANAGLVERIQLMSAVARVQQATGSQTATVVGAMKSLVRYGMESRDSFRDNLKTVVKLHDALGMSTDEAAHLATVTENYALVSFQKVADVLATIVDQTALAAGEVKNLGVELTRSLGLIQPGSLNTMPQILQALSGYEGALKQVTGHVGVFQKLVSHLATPEGIMSTGLLGVSSKILAAEGGIDVVMSRFEAMTKHIVGMTEGPYRALQLDMVGKMFNLTGVEVNEAIKAIELKNSQTIREITLQERFTKEAMNLDQGMGRLLTTLTSLMQQGLAPFVTVLSKLINGAALVVSKIGEWEYAGVTAAFAVGGAILYLSSKLKGVMFAFLEVAFTVKATTEALKRYALSRMGDAGISMATGTAATSGGVLGRMSPWLVRLAGMASALSGILVAVTALASIGYYLWKLKKKETDDAQSVNKAMLQKSMTLESKREHKAYVAARYGNYAEAGDQLNLLMLDVASRMRSAGESQAAIEEAVNKLVLTQEQRMLLASYTRASMDPNSLQGKSSVESKDVVRLLGRMVDLAEDAKKNNDTTMRRTAEGEKAAREHETEITFGRLMERARKGINEGLEIRGRDKVYTQ